MIGHRKMMFFKRSCHYLMLVCLLVVFTQPALAQREKSSSKKRPANDRKEMVRELRKASFKERSGGQADIFIPFFDLDLSPEQVKELRGLADQFRREMQAVRKKQKESEGTAPPGEARETIDKMKRDLYEQALDVLTEKQRLELLKESPEIDDPLGEGSGKTISLELLGQVQKIAPKANTATVSGKGNAIDQLVKPEGELCDDATFVRRVYIDLTGVTPTVEQVLDFLNSTDPEKRTRLIDHLINQPGFADYQAMHWADILRIKSEFPINLWPNGTAVYHRWIRSSILNNKPYDEFAYELLTASGSNFRNPPANFYRATQSNDPYSLAEAAVQTFMGSQLETWPVDQQNEMKKFFEHVAYKQTSEWKEEIVYWDRQKPESLTVKMPDGSEVTLSADEDPRRAFADWLVNDENQQFAQALVNRVWYWLYGEGIVQGPDDFHPDNPATNPELLELLSKEFVASGYDMKALYRFIVTSHVYQQKSPGYPLRPIDAETLQDTLCRIFGTEISFMSDVPEPFSYYPPGMSTILITDGTITNPLMQAFGRPSRDTGLESDRNRTMTEDQRMFMINSTEINGWIERSWMLKVLPLEQKSRIVSLRYLWLEVLSRYPTADELKMANETLGPNEDTARDSFRDLIWMLVNTKEFAIRH